MCSSIQKKQYDSLYDMYGPVIYGLIKQAVVNDAVLSQQILSQVFLRVCAQQVAGKLKPGPAFITLLQMMIKVMNEEGQLPWLPYVERPAAAGSLANG